MLFTDEKNEDLKLLQFMADKTVEEAGLEGEARTALLKAKYSQIDAIHGLATKRGTCLRVMKLAADGRTSQVAGGDCTNLVASGDGSNVALK